MLKLICVLYRIKLLSLSGLISLISALCRYGVNAMTLLSFAEGVYGHKTALVDDFETTTYSQLLYQSEKLAFLLKKNYGLSRGKRAGFLCKNHGSLVKSIFAVSLTGADIYLLNAEMGGSQLNKLLDRYDFDFLIYDFEFIHLIEHSNYKKGKILSYHENLDSVKGLIDTKINGRIKLKGASWGKLVILTGGTTGIPKPAAYRPSLFNYLYPFLTLITRLNLADYNTGYIITPIYHGYGLGVLLLFMALGKKVLISRRFDAKKSCSLIRRYHVEVATVVPLMLHKMLKNNPSDLLSLKCIASGGAELQPRLVERTFRKLGYVLYNLYGTSEAGLNIIATPEDLRYSPKTLGRTIKGTRVKVMDDQKKEVKRGAVGQFYIKNRWSMRKGGWIETGDLGFLDDRGYYFLLGRKDDMVVSAGENVYPIELEQILLAHPEVEDAAVIGVRDELFGQRLKAFVLPVKNSHVSKEELFKWLDSRVARFQMPKDIVLVDNMPYTPLGKLDKKQLSY